MALRIRAYTSLVYQELVRNDVPGLDEHGRLPAVLAGIADPERLAEVGEWLVHCKIGHGARLAPRLAADHGGAARLRVRAQSRRNAACGGGRRRAGETRGDAQGRPSQVGGAAAAAVRTAVAFSGAALAQMRPPVPGTVPGPAGELRGRRCTHGRRRRMKRRVKRVAATGPEAAFAACHYLARLRVVTGGALGNPHLARLRAIHSARRVRHRGHVASAGSRARSDGCTARAPHQLSRGRRRPIRRCTRRGLLATLRCPVRRARGHRAGRLRRQGHRRGGGFALTLPLTRAFEPLNR